MPLKIDKWRGSPAVRAMHPAARSGYLDLILSQWQTDDCSISADQVDLAEQSFLGDELWALYGDRILRNFVTLANGRLRNQVCFEEWEEARRVFHSTHKTLSPEELHEKRSAAGSNGNKVRWGDRKTSQVAIDSSQTDPKPSLTGTETVTQEQKQKPSRGKREQQSDGRHMQFKTAIGSYWEAKNPGVQMPWGPMEGKQLGMWLREAPHITLEQFTGFLRARFKSDVNHSDRPSQWIRWVTSYGSGPIDRFGKPISEEANGANHPTIPGNRSQQRTNGNLAALAAVRAERRNREFASDPSGGEAGFSERGDVATLLLRSGEVPH